MEMEFFCFLLSHFFIFFIHMIRFNKQKSKVENILRTKKEYITKLFYINNLF